MRKFFARRRYKRAIDEASELLRRGRGADARARLRSALADAKIAFDGRGPDVVTVLYALAASELEAGEIDEALRDAEAAEQVLEDESSEGSDDVPSRARIRALVASILEKQGSSPEAYERALTAWSEAALKERDDEGAGAALNQLGLVLGRRGDRDRAAEHFLEAIRLRTRTLGPDAVPTLESIYNGATFRGHAMTLDVAASDLERVIKGAKRDRSTRGRELAEAALHNLGVLREELGDVDGAREALGEALALRKARLGDDHPGLRPTLVRLAQLHHRRGDLVHALSFYERAITIAKSEHPEGHPVVVALEAWRAEVTQGVGPEALRRN